MTDKSDNILSEEANYPSKEQETEDTHTSDAEQAEPEYKRGRKEKIIEYSKRTAFLIVGLFIMSFGVALSIKADLGTSPVSSIPYVLNLITGLSVGTTTIIVNVAIVIIQIILLRKRFKLIRLLQVPVSIAFGLLTDLALLCVDGIETELYWVQWLLCLAGILLVGTGVSMEVTANVTTLPGEGMALTMCELLPKVKFAYMKIAVDCSFVIIAVVLSFSFLHGLYAVREGTVAAALLVGLIAKLVNKGMIPLGNRLFAPLSSKKNRAAK